MSCPCMWNCFELFGTPLHALTLRGQFDLLCLYLRIAVSKHQLGELVHRPQPIVEIPLATARDDVLDARLREAAHSSAIRPGSIPWGSHPVRSEIGKLVSG